MKKDELTALGLSDEQISGVMALGGRDVNSAKATAEDAHKAGTAEAESLKAQIASLTEQSAKQAETHKQELLSLRKAQALEAALRGANAKNADVLQAFLAKFLETAELEEDGTVKGLADEIGKLAKEEATSFLFDASTKPATPKLTGAAPANTATATPDAKRSSYEGQLADARKTGNMAAVVSIKQKAAAEGITI